MWSRHGPPTSWLWLVSPELDHEPDAIHHLNTEPFMGWNIMEGLWCRRTDYDSIPIWDCSGHGVPANDLNMWCFQILLVLFALWSIADTMLKQKKNVLGWTVGSSIKFSCMSEMITGWKWSWHSCWGCFSFIVEFVCIQTEGLNIDKRCCVCYCPWPLTVSYV